MIVYSKKEIMWYNTEANFEYYGMTSKRSKAKQEEINESKQEAIDEKTMDEETMDEEEKEEELEEAEKTEKAVEKTEDLASEQDPEDDGKIADKQVAPVEDTDNDLALPLTFNYGNGSDVGD